MTPDDSEPTRARTALQALLQRRNLTQPEAVDLLHRTARALGITDFAIDSRQFSRWVNGRTGQPHPTARRVLEAAFGSPSAVLLGPDNALTAPVPPAPTVQLSDSCVELVTWLSENSDTDFGTIYQAVSDQLSDLTHQTSAHRALDHHRQASISRAQIAQAVRYYYGPSGGYFSARIDDTPLDLSILVQPSHLSLGADLAADDHTFRLDPSEPAMPFKLGALGTHSAVRRLASVEHDHRVLINRPLYRLLSLTVADATLCASFSVAPFAAYALTADLLEHEMIDTLIDRHHPQAGEPLRDLYLPSLRSVSDYRHRICAGGPVCMTAIARPDDYLLLVQRRSRHVLNVAGRLAVIPKGFHQPTDHPLADTNPLSTIRRELEEELLGRDDLDQLTAASQRQATLTHPNSLTEPARWLLNHPASHSIECTALGINLVSGNYEFAGLVVIDDPAWWNNYGDRIVANWEAQQLDTYSSADTPALARLALDPAWSNEGLFAYLMGLHRLHQRSPRKVRLPRTEITLP